MLFLILSVIFNSLLLIVFKKITGTQNDLRRVILFNYLIGGTAGILLAYSFWHELKFEEIEELLLKAISLGLFLYLGFLTTGWSVASNGLLITSTFLMSSFIIPAIYSWTISGESIALWKVAGVLLVLTGINLTAIKRDTPQRISSNLALLLVFLINGVIQVLFMEFTKVMNEYSFSLFTGLTFMFAAVTGSITITWRGIILYRFSEMKWGIFLGIANYLSILFLIKALSTIPHRSIVFGFLYGGILLLTSIISPTLFKEKLHYTTIAGLIFTFAGICIFYISG